MTEFCENCGSVIDDTGAMKEGLCDDCYQDFSESRDSDDFIGFGKDE